MTPSNLFKKKMIKIEKTTLTFSLLFVLITTTYGSIIKCPDIYESAETQKQVLKIFEVILEENQNRKIHKK